MTPDCLDQQRYFSELEEAKCPFFLLCPARLPTLETATAVDLHGQKSCKGKK